jgi:hypothetical protein
MDAFRTTLIKDSVLGDLTPALDYSVMLGGAQKTHQVFTATSPSNSALIFNVQIPSENVVVGRDVMLQSGLCFTVSIPANYVTAGDKCPLWGRDCSLQAFPLASLMNTATCQINNTTVNSNLKDVLPQLLRMNNSRELLRYNSGTPSLPDMAYGSYAVASGAKNNNPMADYSNCSYDVDQLSRGSFPCVVQYQQFDALTGDYIVPVEGVDPSICITQGNSFKIVVQAIVTEPLLLSPFIWSDPSENAQGIMGVNNMSFTFNIDATLARLVSIKGGAISAVDDTTVVYPTISAGGSVYSSVGVQGTPTTLLFSTLGNVGLQQSITIPQLLFKFFSTSELMSPVPRNVCPYMDFPRYLTINNGAPLASGATNSALQSSNLQINQIPDLFIICARKPMSSQKIYDPSAFLKINSVSINFNNQSGLLSSATANDLWRMSTKNGLNQNWAEWGGSAFLCDGTGLVSSNTATTGSILVINPAFDLSLPAGLSCGSLGNYNLQFSMSVTNQFDETFTPEICVICVNSGLFVTQQGISSVYTGVLSKEIVLSTARAGGGMSSADHSRLVGGKLLNMGLAKRRMGGAMSGGASSGGAMASKSKLGAMC